MDEYARAQQFKLMTTVKVERLVLKMSIPNVIAMIVTSAYNMVDTFFVSQIGTSAAAAAGIVFSIMTIIQAIGFMLGQGSGSIISILLGRRDYDKANNNASASFYMSLVLGAIIAVIGLLNLTNLMKLLGATPTILPYAKDYAMFILIGAPFMTGSFVINNLLRYQGLSALSMIGLSVGAVINTILDPILIFGLNMGIKGAAISTLVSQIISFAVLLYYIFFSKKNILRIRIKYLFSGIKECTDILKVGFPSFCRQGLSSIATVALNVTAASFGDEAVAAISIVGRIFLFLVSIIFGFVQGYQSVAGTNYGANLFLRLRRSFRFCMILGTIILTIAGILGYIFAPNLIALFRANDPLVISIGTNAFRAQCISMPLQTLIVMTNMTFQVLGKSKQATFLSSTRQGIYFFPLIFLLPHFYGLFGLEITQAISDIFSSLTCIPFLYFLFKDMPKVDFHIEDSKEEIKGL